MKTIKLLTFLGMFLSCSAAQAVNVWTDDNAWGEGVDVAHVYLQFLNERVVFKTSDGTSYSYSWDSEPTEQEAISTNAQAVYSMLLTAFASQKNVSVYYDNESSVRNFTLINIHK